MKRTPVIVILLQVLVAAQMGAPPLTVSTARVAGDADSMRTVLRVTNLYDVQATDYVVTAFYKRPPGASCPGWQKDHSGLCVGAFSEQVRTTPHPPGDQTISEVVLPGATTTLSFAAKLDGDIISTENVAVIYADGASYGRPNVLKQMLFERRFRLQDDIDDLNLLQAASASPGTEKYPDLRRQFKVRLAAHSKTLGANLSLQDLYVFGQSTDVQCKMILDNMPKVATIEQARLVINMMIELLMSDIKQLKASHPAITQ